MLGLNWREIEIWVKVLKPHLEGRFIEKVFVPDRPNFTQGYLKGEWAFKLISRKEEGYFYFGLRPNHVYFSYIEGRALKPAPKATQPVFGMALNKFLKGAKIEKIEAVFQERMVVLWFVGEVRMGLVLGLIPSSPQGVLIQKKIPDGNLILAETRVQSGKNQFEFPAPREAPKDLPIRSELIGTLSGFNQTLQITLDEEAFEQRKARALKEIKLKIKEASLRAGQSQTALQEAAREPDWQKYGDLLKASLGTGLQSDGKTWQVFDFESEKSVELPADPQLSTTAQVERFYQNARRKIRRINEAEVRRQRFQERIELLNRYRLELGDLKTLEKIESALGLSPKTGPSLPAKKRAGGWDGKSFLTQEGLFIWLGKSKDENLELTFKQARGNDLWMHLRGKPGAHAVIPLHSGKSPSLETLLDAANLVIFYSGGEHWGKTEVDYTYKKYVKRIKDSTEASYTHNKTLMIEPDPARLKRLISQNS